MEQREKLIELLSDFYYSDNACDSCEHNLETDYECNQCIIEHEVDHLLANGVVVVLPCRCGECAYCEGGSVLGDVLWCKHLKIGVSKYSYCSGGKRKGGGE